MLHFIEVVAIIVICGAALLALGIAFLVSDLGGRCLERWESWDK